MNINNIKQCADFFYDNYLKTFYLLITYYGKSYILIGEKANFPHLMGIQKNTYRSNGYAHPKYLFNDIIRNKPVSHSIIPNNISTTSKMYKKALNFTKSTDIFWKNTGPVTINYNPSLSQTNLNHVNILITDIKRGYMLGWVYNSNVPVNATINIKKYCICTWIDESASTTPHKEKYMPTQNIELIRYIFAFDEKSKLIKKKEYSYDYSQKKSFLQLCERNNSNLNIDSMNAPHYVKIALAESIHCQINNIQY